MKLLLSIRSKLVECLQAYSLHKLGLFSRRLRNFSAATLASFNKINLRIFIESAVHPDPPVRARLYKVAYEVSGDTLGKLRRNIIYKKVLSGSYYKKSHHI